MSAPPGMSPTNRRALEFAGTIETDVTRDAAPGDVQLLRDLLPFEALVAKLGDLLPERVAARGGERLAECFGKDVEGFGPLAGEAVDFVDSVNRVIENVFGKIELLGDLVLVASLQE